MLDLSGKAAFVTGGGSGIGRGICLAFARAGADVLIADVTTAGAEETAAQVRALGRKAVVRQVDVRDKAALEEAVQAAIDELGGFSIAVANAGIGRGGTVLTMSEEDWDTQIDVNLKGVFLTVQAASRAMVRQNKGGRIICISSVAGERPAAGLFAYCASKAGVRMATRCWALELAPMGITVNSIGPGIIDTPLGAPLLGEGDDRALAEQRIPAGRAGQPMDIGNLACWLASDEAEYVTGTYNIMDGGLADGSGFGVPRNLEQANMIRQARRTMSGDQLLAIIDQTTAQVMAEAEKSRKERGLQ